MDKLSDKYREVWVKRGTKWHKINFDNIKTGDVFMLKEPDGEVVKDNRGVKVFTAVSDAYPGRFSNMKVDIDKVKTEEGRR